MDLYQIRISGNGDQRSDVIYQITSSQSLMSIRQRVVNHHHRLKSLCRIQSRLPPKTKAVVSKKPPTTIKKLTKKLSRTNWEKVKHKDRLDKEIED